ncbi:MAG: DUF2927 domain-containing protein [Pseudomonadota bacterium]
MRPLRPLALRLLPALFALGLAGCAPDTEARYAWALAHYESRGLMRTETAPADAPFGDAELVRNFERIAFHKEFADGDALRAEATPVRLLKWESPVRWTLAGDGATARDEARLRALTARLERLTGLAFEEVEDSPDLFVLIATRRGRQVFLDALERMGALERMSLIVEWARNDTYPCVGQVGRSRAPGGWETRATIVIKDETRGLLRESCLQEELVQTLGLLNDHEKARPSIFNDDQEFALLTEHDEYLLRILYDPRLERGMTAEEGMPVVREIVAEIGPGPAPAAVARE